VNGYALFWGIVNAPSNLVIHTSSLHPALFCRTCFRVKNPYICLSLASQTWAARAHVAVPLVASSAAIAIPQGQERTAKDRTLAINT
jgi:hypothetical protein